MATTPHLLTWQEFEQLPDEHAEILEGELITLPPPKSKHSLVAENVAELLRELKAKGLGRVLCEAGYKLSEALPSWIQPDVSFLKMERVQATESDSYFLGAPELAVEIVSPSETPATLHRKVDLLLAAGSLAVWVIYLETRKIHVFLPDGTSFHPGINDVLTLPELLPDWELPVAKIFED
jgi:Uma2 family endonuclease